MVGEPINQKKKITKVIDGIEPNSMYLPATISVKTIFNEMYINRF
jgi:hypothetical protein